MTEGNAQYGFMKGILNADPLTPLYYSSLSAAPQIYQDAVANGMGVTTDGDKYIHLTPSPTIRCAACWLRPTTAR